MNQEIKKRWIDALQSCLYKQGQQCLRDGDKYCCLGVLCDLHQKENPNIKGWDDDGYLGRPLTPPLEVLDWAGIPHENLSLGSIQQGGGEPIVSIPGHHSLVPLGAIVNDEMGMTFAQIADIIEKQM